MTIEKLKETKIKMVERMKALYVEFQKFIKDVNNNKETFNLYKSHITNELNNMKYVIENTNVEANSQFQQLFYDFKNQIDLKNNELMQISENTNINNQQLINEYNILFNNFNQLLIKNKEQNDEIEFLRNDLFNVKELANNQIAYLNDMIEKDQKINYEKDEQIRE